MKTWLSSPLLAAVALASAGVPLGAATLSDFGHGRMRLDGKLPLGSRDLLLVLVNDFDDGTNRVTRDYFDSLVFNRFGTNSQEYVNGFFLENSLGRFSFNRAGIVGPINYNRGQLEAIKAPSTNFCVRSSLMFSNFIYRAMATNTFDFDAADKNSDGTVTDDELEILVINNNTGCCGANFCFGPVRHPNFSSKIEGTFAIVNICSSLDTICHELVHGLGDGGQCNWGDFGCVAERGPIDLYPPGCSNGGVTLMSCTCGPTDVPGTIHLDPWHKVQLGWAEPRIRSLGSGGVATLYAPQMERDDSAIILYDPQRGTDEFFMLEYRTPATINGSVYDGSVASEGLAIWHVRHDGGKNAGYVSNTVERAVFNLGAPNFVHAGNQLWRGSTLTPHLRWLDGTVTTTRIFVRPFTTNSSQITIEWWTEEGLWVDFNFSGFPFEDGKVNTPYNTLTEGLNAVPYGGILNIKAGASSETALISKRMLIRAVGGLVTIGQ